MAPDDRRASIIEATLPLLREKGSDVSTKEISRAAGVAEGTIFRVFDSKDALITACVHQAFDNAELLARLAEVDRALPLRERLAEAVEVMQDHLEGIFTLMGVLQANGQPLHRHAPGDALRRRREAATELDRAFTDLVGDDAGQLRIPVTSFLAYLRMLTLSSVHPMLERTEAKAHELVDVLLDGALERDSATTRNRGKK
jgi:AcrR family transcriptional regulator